MAGRLQCTSLVPVLRRQRQADLCEFKAGLVYRANSRTTRTVIRRNLVSETTPERGEGERQRETERETERERERERETLVHTDQIRNGYLGLISHEQNMGEP